MSRQASLTYRTADGREERVQLDPRGETSIGRHPACTITVSQPSVSRKHARIYFEAGGFYVEDLKSSNGTYINNQRIEQASLAEGDELRCGDFALQFSQVAGAPSGTREVPSATPPARPSIRPVGHLSNRRISDKPGKPARPTALPTGRTPKRPPPSPIEVTPAPVPAQPSVDEAELQRLRDQATRLLEVEQQLAELRADNDDKARRIRALESEDLRAEEQIKTLTDRSLRLRDEVQAQQRQLEEYRVERNDLEVSLAETRQQNDQLRRNEEITERDRAEMADQINDLKREVGQRDKQIRQLEQQQSVLEYDLRAAREENDDLRLALGEDDTERKDLNTTLDHLRQVIAEKEAVEEQLNTDLRRLRDKVAHVEQTAKEDSGARVGRLREALGKAEAERDLLANKLAAAERQNAAPRSRNAAQEIDQLKRSNRELRQALEDAQGQGDWAAEREELEAHLALARAQARDAEQRAQAAARPGRGGGDDARYAALRGAAFELYDGLNDLANDLRMNIEAASGLAGDLHAVQGVFAQLPLDRLPAAKTAIEELDLGFTLEDIGQALQGASEGAGQFRKTMRRLRSIVDDHGYGS